MKPICFLTIMGMAVAGVSVRAGNVTLDSVSTFSGTVAYDSAYTDWRVFSATNNGGSAVVSASGGGLISGIATDGGTVAEYNDTIPATWTLGTPVGSALADPGYYAVLGGNQYGQYIGKPSYASFTVISPSADYSIDLYINNWGYQSFLDLTLSNGGTVNSYNSFAASAGYFEHLVMNVTGAGVGSLTTVQFTDFNGNDSWGQLGFFSADVISVPEPATLALAGMAMFSLLLRRRN